MSTETVQDAKTIMLDNQLRDLRTQRSRVRPSLAFLVGIAFLILGALFVHGMFGILLAVLGVAGLLAGVAALAKRSALDIIRLPRRRSRSKRCNSATGENGQPAALQFAVSCEHFARRSLASSKDDR